MLDEEREREPPPDGRQFDVVRKYTDLDPGDVGPEIPTAPDPTEGDGDSQSNPRVQTLFWTLVLVLKFALITTSLGLLMIGFDRLPSLGWQLLAAGLVLFVYAGYRYRRSRRELAEIVDDDTDPESAATEARDGRDPNG